MATTAELEFWKNGFRGMGTISENVSASRLIRPEIFHIVIPNIDKLVKSQKSPFSVIPAKAGIQSFQIVTGTLDSGFHRSDDL
jgi:hypothetical protein